MTAAFLALALVPPPQSLKQIEIDRFNTPYSVQQTGGLGDLHEWYGLNHQQCFFYRRATLVQVNANPNATVLTFSIGDGRMTFSSPKQIYWQCRLDYFTQNGTYLDLSNVKRFYVDCDSIPDIAVMYAYDKWHHGGSSGWSIHQGGIYCNRIGFGGNLDWKNIYNIEFRLDFDQNPNPLNVTYSRIYMTTEPGLIGSGSSVNPLRVGPGG